MENRTIYFYRTITIRDKGTVSKILLGSNIIDIKSPRKVYVC